MKKVLKFFWKGLVPEGFNYPYTRVISNAFYGKKATLRQNALFVIGFLPVIRNFFLKPSVSERIIEDPFVLSQVQKLPKGSKVLDFGCFSSMVPLQLASIGYRVTGIDLYNYPYTHPNFIFHNQDILDNKLKSKSYDCIYAISSLEHVGRGWYEKERKNATDVAVVEQFYRLLKPGGTLLVTLPFGKLIQTPYMKVYDLNTFKKLFKDFKVRLIEYYLKRSEVIWSYAGINSPKLPELKKSEIFNYVICTRLTKTDH